MYLRAQIRPKSVSNSFENRTSKGTKSENRKVFAFLFLLATGLMAERSAPMCNSLRMYACKHPTSPTITHLPLAGRHQTKKTQPQRSRTEGGLPRA